MSFIPECFKSPPFSKPRTIKNKELDTTDERKTEKKNQNYMVHLYFFSFESFMKLYLTIDYL